MNRTFKEKRSPKRRAERKWGPKGGKGEEKGGVACAFELNWPLFLRWCWRPHHITFHFLLLLLYNSVTVTIITLLEYQCVHVHYGPRSIPSPFKFQLLLSPSLTVTSLLSFLLFFLFQWHTLSDHFPPFQLSNLIISLLDLFFTILTTSASCFYLLCSNYQFYKKLF